MKLETYRQSVYQVLLISLVIIAISGNLIGAESKDRIFRAGAVTSKSHRRWMSLLWVTERNRWIGFHAVSPFRIMGSERRCRSVA